VVEGLFAAVDRFVGQAPQADDITALVLSFSKT
jgi:serine phosphatase RsbU (regulator of sigma subunit)